MTSRRPEQVAEAAVALYCDNKRIQFWALFFTAVWMLLYIGQALPLWLIAAGILVTLAGFAAVIIIWRPRQVAAWVEAEHVTTPRFMLPPRRWQVEQPVQLQRLADADLLLLSFKPQQRRLRKVICWNDAESVERLAQLGIQLSGIQLNE